MSDIFNNNIYKVGSSFNEEKYYSALARAEQELLGRIRLWFSLHPNSYYSDWEIGNYQVDTNLKNIIKYEAKCVVKDNIATIFITSRTNGQTFEITEILHIGLTLPENLLKINNAKIKKPKIK